LEVNLYTFHEESRNVHTVRVDLNRNSEWEFWVLLSADRHHDNKFSEHKLETRHLDEATEKGAPVLDFGDLFCCMQGKWDKRKDQNQLRDELRGNNYLDDVVQYNAEYYAKYADNLELVCKGNHETSISNHHQVNLTNNLVDKIHRITGKVVHTGGYSGWVRFLFSSKNKTYNTQFKMYYHHGAGGSAPVTKGVIRTARQSAYLLDADIVVSGHTHSNWIFVLPKIGLSHSGKIYHKNQTHIKCPGYQGGWQDGYGGWAVEKDFGPTSLGAWWLKFTWDRVNEIVKYTTVMAC